MTSRRAGKHVRESRVRYAFAILYLGIVLVDAVGVVDQGFGRLALWVVSNFAAGFLIGRWWALLLPLVAIAVVAPLGEPNNGEVSAAVGMAFNAPFALALVLAGVVARRMLARWHNDEVQASAVDDGSGSSSPRGSD